MTNKCLTKMVRPDQFENLEVGQMILVRWGETRRGMKKWMLYNVERVLQSPKEVLCKKGSANHYFNWELYLNGCSATISRSNAKEVYLVHDVSLNLFDQLKAISNNDGRIVKMDACNVKRSQTGSNGWGEITIAVPNNIVLDFDNWIPVFLMVHDDEIRGGLNNDK